MGSEGCSGMCNNLAVAVMALEPELSRGSEGQGCNRLHWGDWHLWVNWSDISLKHNYA